MSTKKTTTKKVTTGAKSVKTSAPMDARVKTETKPAAKVEAVVASTPVAKTEAVVASKPVAKTEAVVASKPVAKTEAVVAKPASVEVVTAGPVMKFVPRHEVDALVREAAFLFAKRRNFRNGTPTQDWFAAEALVSERLTARGYTVSA